MQDDYRAMADMSSFTTVPICPKCNNGFASDLHYFTSCVETEEDRILWGVADLNELYACNPGVETLRRYAGFAIAIGIVPDV
jgi:hypothetical protein